MRWMLLALLFPMAAQGQTYGLDLVSAHIPRADGQNNINPGAYARFDNGLLLGTYRNTWRRQSLLIAYQYEFKGTPFGLIGGAVSGYQRKTIAEPCQTACYSPATHTSGFSRGYFTPMVAVTAALPGIAGITPRVTFIPGSSSVFHLSIEKPF